MQSMTRSNSVSVRGSYLIVWDCPGTRDGITMVPLTILEFRSRMNALSFSTKA